MVKYPRFLMVGCTVWLLVVAFALAACGDDQRVDSSGSVLTPAEVEALLVELPYEFTFAKEKQATAQGPATVRGRATGPQGTMLKFGFSIGEEPEAVPVGRAGTRMAYAYPSAGFVYTDDLMIETRRGALIPNPRFNSYARWRHAGDMGVAITAELCRATTGEPCPP
jgi:hypothetical protein